MDWWSRKRGYLRKNAKSTETTMVVNHKPKVVTHSATNTKTQRIMVVDLISSTRSSSRRSCLVDHRIRRRFTDSNKSCTTIVHRNSSRIGDQWQTVFYSFIRRSWKPIFKPPRTRLISWQYIFLKWLRRNCLMKFHTLQRLNTNYEFHSE